MCVCGGGGATLEQIIVLAHSGVADNVFPHGCFFLMLFAFIPCIFAFSCGAGWEKILESIFCNESGALFWLKRRAHVRMRAWNMYGCSSCWCGERDG